MTQPAGSFTRQLGEKVLRVVIAIVGLLVLRVVLSALPVVNHAAPLYPQVWTDVWEGVVDPSRPEPRPTEIQNAIQKTFGDNSPIILDSLRKAIETEVGRNQNDRSLVLSAYQHWLISAHLALFPITIAHAVIDTLVLLILILFGTELRNLYRSGYPRFPDAGQILNMCVLTLAAAIAYISYQGVLYPLIGADGQQAYDWIFLLIGLAPLIGAGVLAARNMDRLTALIMRPEPRNSLVATGMTACARCTHTMQAGTKFCPDCGAAAALPNTVPAPRHCSSCAAENLFAAKFCRECGQPM